MGKSGKKPSSCKKKRDKGWEVLDGLNNLNLLFEQCGAAIPKPKRKINVLNPSPKLFTILTRISLFVAMSTKEKQTLQKKKHGHKGARDFNQLSFENRYGKLTFVKHADTEEIHMELLPAHPDLTLLLVIMLKAQTQRKVLDGKVAITLGGLCTAIGHPNSSATTRKRVLQSLERLAGVAFKIEVGEKMAHGKYEEVFYGTLLSYKIIQHYFEDPEGIDSGFIDIFLINMNEDMVHAMIENQFTYVNMDIWKKLSDRGKLIFGFYQGQKSNVCSHSLLNIIEMFERGELSQPVWRYRAKIKTALAKMVKLGFLEEFKITKDRVIVKKRAVEYVKEREM